MQLCMLHEEHAFTVAIMTESNIFCNAKGVHVFVNEANACLGVICVLVSTNFQTVYSLFKPSK